jgi:hypothetical protein
MADELPQPDIAKDPHAVVPVEEVQSFSGNIPPPVIDSTVGNPGAFTDMPDELPQPIIAQDPHVVEETQKLTSPPVIDSSADKPEYPHAAPVEEIQNPTPPPVIDSTADIPIPPQPDTTQHPHAVAPVELHVEPAAANVPKPAEDEVVVAEGLVEEPTSYFDGPMAESLKDFDPTDHADHADNKAEFSEAVNENANITFPEPLHEPHGEAREYYGDAMPTAVENANVIMPEPEPEAHHNDDFIPVTTKLEEIQQKTEPVPVPNYGMPSYPMNLGSEREVWGGEREGLPNPYDAGYSSSVPSSEIPKQVERSAAPSIRFVDLFYFFNYFLMIKPLV